MADVNISKYRAQVVREGSTPASPGFVVSEGQDPVNPSGTSNYVPYSGAISNVDLGEFGLDTGFVTLDTTPTNIPTEQGGIYWDDTRSTAVLIMNGVLQHIGQDTFFYVKNSTGASIPKGTSVRFDGTDGASGHLKIAPFLANGTYPSNYFVGVTAETIANGAFGQVIHFGELDGINTSSYTAGALLYASTTVAGGFQTTAPVAPNNIVLIAAAINSKNNGTILVRPTYGSNINTDEGVKITTPTTGQLLQLQASGLWENKTKAQVLGGTSSQFVKGDGSLDSTIYVSGSGTSGQVAFWNGTNTQTGDNGLFWDNTNKRLGVGTTTIGVIVAGVTTKLDVNGSILSAPSSGDGTLAFSRVGGRFGYLTAGTSGCAFGFSNGGFFQIGRIPTLASGSQTNDFRIASTGNILINSTVDAGFRVDINGTARVQSNLTVTATNATGDFATIDGSNIIRRRTAAQVLTDIGGQAALTNPITGTGTTNYLPKFTGSTSLGNSQIFDNGTNVGIGTASPVYKVDLLASSSANSDILRAGMSGVSNGFTVQRVSSNFRYSFLDGNVGIGTDAPSVKLNVSNAANGNIALFTNTADADLFVNLTSGVTLLTPSTGTLAFGTLNTERVRLNINGNLLVGTTLDNGSKLQVNGSFSAPHVTKSANYTLDATDYTVGFDCASNRTATLPDATTCQGRIYVIYQFNTGSGARSVTLDGNGSQTINGVTTYSLSPFCEYSSVMIQSNGANWIIISSNFTTDCL